MMTKTRFTRARNGVAAAALTLAAGGAAVATAPPAAAAAAPACVWSHLSDGRWSDTVTVYNQCARSVRVKVVWANATDSSCWYLRPGSGFTSTKGYPARYAGLSTC